MASPNTEVRYLGINDLCERWSCSHMTVERLASTDPDFPTCIKLGPSHWAHRKWRLDEIERWERVRRHARAARRRSRDGELTKYDAACRAIAEAKTADEVLHIRDQATAMRAARGVAKNRQLEMTRLKFACEPSAGWERRRRRSSSARAAVLQKLVLARNRFPPALRGGLRQRPPIERLSRSRPSASIGSCSARAQRLAEVSATDFELHLGQRRKDATRGLRELASTSVHWAKHRRARSSGASREGGRESAPRTGQAEAEHPQQAGRGVLAAVKAFSKAIDEAMDAPERFSPEAVRFASGKHMKLIAKMDLLIRVMMKKKPPVADNVVPIRDRPAP